MKKILSIITGTAMILNILAVPATASAVFATEASYDFANDIYVSGDFNYQINISRVSNIGGLDTYYFGPGDWPTNPHAVACVKDFYINLADSFRPYQASADCSIDTTKLANNIPYYANVQLSPNWASFSRRFYVDNILPNADLNLSQTGKIEGNIDLLGTFSDPEFTNKFISVRMGLSGAEVIDEVSAVGIENGTRSLTIDTTALFDGPADFILEVQDFAGNVRKITKSVIIDNDGPTIQLNGSDTVTIKEKEQYIELGALATDIVDGDISSAIVVDSNVDNSKAGDYEVTYNASDSSGNVATGVKRKVVVEALPVVKKNKNDEEDGQNDYIAPLQAVSEESSNAEDEINALVPQEDEKAVLGATDENPVDTMASDVNSWNWLWILIAVLLGATGIAWLVTRPEKKKQ